jgi:hypothetical protein
VAVAARLHGYTDERVEVAMEVFEGEWGEKLL